MVFLKLSVISLFLPTTGFQRHSFFPCLKEKSFLHFFQRQNGRPPSVLRLFRLKNGKMLKCRETSANAKMLRDQCSPFSMFFLCLPLFLLKPLNCRKGKKEWQNCDAMEKDANIFFFMKTGNKAASHVCVAKLFFIEVFFLHNCIFKFALVEIVLKPDVFVSEICPYFKINF